jgi:DNA-binding MarR family transcriptional regulator
MKDVLDPIDRRILRELQADATLPIAELAERAGLSQTPCWKRVKRLEADGVIERRPRRPPRRGLAERFRPGRLGPAGGHGVLPDER